MRHPVTSQVEPFTYSKVETPRAEFETTRQREISRRSRDYIRWVQRSLNQILGLRLAVDGIKGPATRSAIRNFQQSRGLATDGIVGPRTEAAIKYALAGQPRPATPVPLPAVRPSPVPTTRAAAPPTEGPYGGITGTPCGTGGGKCWRGARSRDIVDSDAPWNDEANRSPANYDAVLDYFNVANPQNHRYRPGGGSTYCNIYVHDVTRAMWASVPHWVRDPRQRSGWNELSANRTYDWMRSNARSIGWILINSALCQWLVDQHSRAQSLPFSDPTVPGAIVVAGSQVAAGNHPNPTLLSQPSYVAQQFANLGLPVVIIWRNPAPDRHGHMAMVRSERDTLRGQVDAKTGVFVPRSAQAGSRNWNNELAKWIARSGARGPNGAHLYVHS